MNSALVSGTMRFTGLVNGHQVQILLDGGSDDSFIQPRLAKFLHLDVQPSVPFKVMVGNGSALQVEGIVQNFQVQVQGHVLKIPVYLLSIEGAEIILGADWLSTLGSHVMNYKDLFIQFYVNDQFVTIYGDKKSGPHMASMHQLYRLCRSKGIAACYSLSLKSGNSNSMVIDTVNSSVPILETELEFPMGMPESLQHLLLKYKRIFSVPSSLPPSRACDHRINLQLDSQPVKVRPYRYPHSQKNEIEIMVNQMLQDGLIEHSISPFSSPVILVKKKDGTWRFCIDYRALNALTIKDAYPIPTVDELLDELNGAQIFSKLDLRSGYHQVLVHPADRFKTAFRTHHGHFQWLVMPFGLSNAPATFQALMNGIFHFAMRRYVLIFFDDILVYSKDMESHLVHLEQVLFTLQENQLFAKYSKCCFGLFQIEYLGHVVSARGVQMDQTKVDTILQWPVPTNLKQL